MKQNNEAPRNIGPHDFLAAFHQEEESVCLRIISDRKHEDHYPGQNITRQLKTIETLTPALRTQNAKHRGVFFCPNSGGHTDAQITHINAIWVECDDLPKEQQMENIRSFPLPPSVIVETRSSLHCYWLVDDVAVSDFRRYQKGLAARFKGDSHCCNPSRVMRLPGFDHCKQEPFPVKCVLFEPERRYHAEEFAQHLLLEDFAAVRKKNTVQIRDGEQPGLERVVNNCEFIQYARDNAANLSEGEWYAMITNLASFAGGRDCIHAFSEPYGRYNSTETDLKINHYIRSGTGPMRCDVIAEKCGFVCSKRERGECNCHSPAACCYLPYTLDEIDNALKAQPVTSKTLMDFQTAKAFVTEYLIKMEPLSATVYINNDVKTHFGFRQHELKLLVETQKEAYQRAHQERPTAAEEFTNLDYPWYEETKNGVRFLPGVLADHLKKNTNAFFSGGSLYFYEHGVYARHDDEWTEAYVRSFMYPEKATTRSIQDALHQWCIQTSVAPDELQCNPFVLNVKNGLLDVRTMKLTAHTPEHRSTNQFAASYDPSATCPRFIAAAMRTVGAENLPAFQEFVGYLLVPTTITQKVLIMVGPGGSGKSVMLLALRNILLGEQNVSDVPLQNLDDRFMSAELYRKLANICADLPSKAIKDAGAFKRIAAGDVISAERKNGHPFSFQPYARLVFSCNELPRNCADRTNGFYRKLLILRCGNEIAQSERDPFLLKNLEEERDGIFLWAIEGLKRLMNNQFQFSRTAAMEAEIESYRIESDSVLAFVEECCKLEEQGEAKRADAYRLYKSYCGENHLMPVSQIHFNRSLEAHFPTVHRAKSKDGTVNTWRGLTLDRSSEYYDSLMFA